MVDNGYIYKASIVKSLFSSNPLSRDRLRKVRGLTKFTDDSTGNSDGQQAIESSLMVGDPLLVKVKDRLKIAKIEAIRVANRKVKTIEVDGLSKPNVMMDVKLLKVEENDGHFIWLGEFVGDSFRSSGTSCYAIQPELKEINGRDRFAFDKQFILDYDVAVNIEAEQQRQRKVQVHHQHQIPLMHLQVPLPEHPRHTRLPTW